MTRLHYLLPIFTLLFLPETARPSDVAAPGGSDRAVSPARTREQIEADWLRQAEVRGVPVDHGAAPVTPEEDARGGCDGFRSGSYGFHTGLDRDPWWQIDLERPIPLDEILIYNRCDGSYDRAWKLKVLLSADGKTWQDAYQHDGTPFFGEPDNKPLSVRLKRAKARYVRIQVPGETYLHLDEVEIYQSRGHNLALRKNATQSSASPWSTRANPPAVRHEGYPVATMVERGLKVAESLRAIGVGVDAEVRLLQELDRRIETTPEIASGESRQYFEACAAVRRMALANPQLDFEDLLFVKRMPARFTTSPTSGTYTHMSDQYYGWFSRPGGGLYVLQDFKTEHPRLRCLTKELPPGNILRPDISYDGTRALFAFCRYYEDLARKENKLDKSTIPEDAFYHLYEVRLDGTGLRRLTAGKYDDFDGRYLPNGDIVFLSTRRGNHIQCGKSAATASLQDALPDSYVRCGGDAYRPVAIYTLHTIDAAGGNLRQISPFESFEWTPSIDHQGRILYARWDYVDRNAMPYISLWSTLPDGTGARAVFGNYTDNPHCVFEARAIPGSQKIIFTASAHHSNTAGSLVLLDPNRGSDGTGPMTRLTPEVPFPEVEAWPNTYFANPYPLSEEHYLVAWSDRPLRQAGDEHGGALGIYLFDAFGNLNLLYRDPSLSCENPLPVRPRQRPPQVSPRVDWDGPQEGRMVVADVYRGLESIPRGSIRRLRVVGIPAKAQPNMNRPVLGLAMDDPGKFVLGTVPVDADGSVHFRVPSGVSFFLQALDEEGMAVQTMRTATYVQPGEVVTCIGCHEPRNLAPPNRLPLAARREPSKLEPGVEGSWPLDYQVLLQPVLERRCVQCHRPGGEDADFDLTAEKSYLSLVDYGNPSMRAHVLTRYREGRSTAGSGAAQTSPLVKLLKQGHYEVQLDGEEWERLSTWLDLYGQRLGSFGEEQEERLRQFRTRIVSSLGSPNQNQTGQAASASSQN